jgi:hypothetical protein
VRHAYGRKIRKCNALAPVRPLRLNRRRIVAIRPGAGPWLRNVQLAFSRFTSVGLLPSRIPRNTGCRNRSSRVQSVNLHCSSDVAEAAESLMARSHGRLRLAVEIRRLSAGERTKKWHSLATDILQRFVAAVSKLPGQKVFSVLLQIRVHGISSTTTARQRRQLARRMLHRRKTKNPQRPMNSKRRSASRSQPTRADGSANRLRPSPCAAAPLPPYSCCPN